MTNLVGTNSRAYPAPVRAFALAAALAAAVVGGTVAAFGLAGGQHAPGVAAPGGGSAVDQKWVEYGNDWQSRYRQMYPATLDSKWVEYGNRWERDYRAQRPDLSEAKWTEYGLAWQRQYQQQHPTP
jgi:hypothetical protein